MKKTIYIFFLLFSFTVVESQNLISVPFTNGFVGNNSANNQSTNAYYLSGASGLGWTNVQFAQSSTSNIFVAQGNDIIGMVLITDANGVEHTINGFVKWRAPSGSVTTLVFQPQAGSNFTLATNGFNGSSSYVIDDTKYIGLTFNGQTLSISPVPGTVSGNAATNGLLDALNNYLGSLPSVSIQQTASVTEGITTITLTITLSAASSNTVSVNYANADGSAIVGSDYSLATGTVTFAPGQTTQTITITIINDSVAESTENFTVTLTDPVNASILNATCTVTITDNDSVPTINISNNLSGFISCTGLASSSQSFTISGTSLTNNVVVTAPTGYEVSLTSGSGYASSVTITASGTLTTTTVFVRLAASASGSPSGNIAITSTGATTQNIAITGSVTTIFISGSQMNIPCNGGSNGLATVSPSGGTTPYTYAWSPSGGTASTASGLSAGTYICTVTDVNGCTATRNFTITQPTAITVSALSQTNVACNGTATGSASITSPTGGAGGYTYNWTPGNPTGDGTRTVTGLSAGVWTCTVTDANNCSASQSFTITEPTAITVSALSQTNVACNGTATGSASITSPTGGAAGYTYNWTPGNPTGDGTRTVTGLSAGVWTCTVTDANNCSASQSFTITEPTAITVSALSQTNVACNGTATGSASITSPTGGAGGYTYNWTPGNPTGDGTRTVTGLSAGVWTCTVTDANNCSASQSFTITEPTAITVSALSQTNVACNGTATGSASITSPTGGAGGYTYNWTPGNPTGDGTRTVTGLSAGVWTCTVTDANNCSASQSFTITEPTAITVSALSQTNVACNGTATGSASITSPTGGAGGYTYNWTPGNPTGDGTRTVTGLSAGVWTCTVTDANNCSASQSFTITEPTAITVSALSQTNVACNGTATGSASITSPTGGAGGYTYNWTPGNPTGDGTRTVTGLSAGVWTCTVTDANNCSSSQSFTITEPTAITVSALSQTNVACNGTATGSASITSPTGGAGGYTYNWTPGNPTGDGTRTVTGLSAGVWTCTITDANNCSASQSFTITEPTALVLSGSQLVTPCSGASNGTATVSTSGGSGSYTYVWSPSGGTASTATGLSADTYTCTVTDSNGCTATRTVIVTAPLSAGTLSGTQSVCIGSITTFSSTVSGGTWTSSDTTIASVNTSTGVITGVAAGTATITYTVAGTGGCADATATRTVTVTAAPSAGTLSGTQVVCVGSTTTFTATNSSPGISTLGSALDFDGNNDYVTAPSGVYFDDNTFTIESWVYVTAHNFYQRLFDFGNGITNNNVLFVLSEATNGKPGFNIYDASGQGHFINSPSPLPLNQWVHLAAVRNGTFAGIYVNGTLVVSANDWTVSTPNATRNNCYIGKDNWGSNVTMSAKIGEFRIWTTARTQAQIQANMDVLALPQSDLRLLYRFDQGVANQANTSITTVTDHSGSNYINGAPANGTLNNFALSGSFSNWTIGRTISQSGTWSSSDNSIATVDSNGLVTGVSAGTAIITYTVFGTGGCSDATATRTATVTALPSAGTLSGIQSVLVGNTTTFLSTVTGGAWTSSDTTIATVNSSTGVITGIAVGTATITYTVTGTGGCADATVTRTIVVTSLVDAVNDTPPTITAGDTTSSVITNDTLDGSPAVIGTNPGQVTLTGVTVPTGLTLNANGTITVAAGTPSGTYTLTYQICENGATPANCDTATVTIVVSNVINAVNDTPPTITAGDTTSSVITNDILNGSVAVIGTNPGQVTLTGVTVPTGLTLNANGTITVAAGTPSGTYTLTYQICENGATPANCDTATVTIVVSNVINAVNDTPPTITAGDTTSSVITNDILNGSVAVIGTNPGQVTLTGVTVPTGLTLNANGTITVAAGTPSGTYTLTYQICENGATPANCDTATVTIVVSNVINAVNDSPPTITAGDTTSSVITNDILNGSVAVIGTNPGQVTLTGVTVPTGLTLNANGTITVAAGTPSGTYTLTYQICENGATPANCDTATVTIVVSNVINAVNDTPPTITAGDTTSSVITNDTLNGSVAVIGTNPGQVTLTGVTVPTGLTLNANGTITVASGTPSGTYTLTYQICENGATPANCDTASVTVIIGSCLDFPINDCDGDGVTNGQEILNGTNPSDPCSFVLASQTATPSSAWLAADCDGDGVTNGQELLDGTNPSDPCSYVASSQTLTTSSQWLAADCDGDGVTNGQEIIDGTNPNDPCSAISSSITLPLSQDFLSGDCDGDGLSNEIEIGPNPNQPFDPNGNGIPDYLEVNTFISLNNELEVFNLVTPNGDGDNDVLVIRNIEMYPENSLEIYNRWGVKVFGTEGYGQNGKFFRGISEGRATISQSSELPVGTYWYILKYKNLQGVWNEKVGYLYLNK